MVKTMETELNVILTLLLFLVLIMGFPNTSLSDQEKEFGRNCFLRTTVNPTEYSKEGTETEQEWGYGCDGGVGPSEWGNLSPKWSLCGNGTQQSPIRILSFDVLRNRWLDELQMEYHFGPATITNDGNIVRLRWNGGVLYVEGLPYELYETQFHAPSEHTINGRIYPLEMQMVHKDTSNGGLAVLSVLFRLHRKDNKFLDQFWPYLSSLKKDHIVNIEEGVSPRELHLEGKHYYRYNGSLTSPPCTEGVVWTVVKKVYHRTSSLPSLVADSIYVDIWSVFKARNWKPIAGYLCLGTASIPWYMYTRFMFCVTGPICTRAFPYLNRDQT